MASLAMMTTTQIITCERRVAHSEAIQTDPLLQRLVPALLEPGTPEPSAAVHFVMSTAFRTIFGFLGRTHVNLSHSNEFGIISGHIDWA